MPKSGDYSIPADTLGAMAYQGVKLHPVAGKCGVFAETDVVNLIKSGVPASDILFSLADAIVLQNLSVLARGNTLPHTVLLLGGPSGTALIGFADGTLGIWKLDNGALLERRRLHGPVAHLLLDGAKVYAATELGATLTWDLGVLRDDYCELLRRVWREVPVVWEHGLPVRRDPPDHHRCAIR